MTEIVRSAPGGQRVVASLQCLVLVDPEVMVVNGVDVMLVLSEVGGTRI